MGLEKKTGTYGDYWTNTIDSSNSLNEEQMKLNATYIKNYLTDKGWTINSICAILGNMQSESAINPGRWESDKPGILDKGYGLVQWTPASKYINWVTTGEPFEIDNNLSRIDYEVENNKQWIATNEYNYTFKEFTTKLDTVTILAQAFLTNYERPLSSNQPQRGVQAQAWLDYFNVTPVVSKTKTKKHKFNWIFLINN